MSHTLTHKSLAFLAVEHYVIYCVLLRIFSYFFVAKFSFFVVPDSAIYNVNCFFFKNYFMKC